MRLQLFALNTPSTDVNNFWYMISQDMFLLFLTQNLRLAHKDRNFDNFNQMYFPKDLPKMPFQ